MFTKKETRALQQGCADFSMLLGRGLMLGGGIALFAMAVIGTLAIDIVILCALLNSNSRISRDAFCTGFLFGFFFSGRSSYRDYSWELLVSPITSAIAAVLSFALGVPEIGIALVVGWTAALLLYGLGVGFMKLGEWMQPDLGGSGLWVSAPAAAPVAVMG